MTTVATSNGLLEKKPNWAAGRMPGASTVMLKDLGAALYLAPAVVGLCLVPLSSEGADHRSADRGSAVGAAERMMIAAVFRRIGLNLAAGNTKGVDQSYGGLAMRRRRIRMGRVLAMVPASRPLGFRSHCVSVAGFLRSYADRRR